LAIKERNTKLDTSSGIKLNPICDNLFQKINSKESAYNTIFNVVNLTTPFQKHLHIRGYVDFYGGYAEHTRKVLFGLQNSGKYNIKLTPIKTPIDIDPITWNDLNNFIYPVNFKMEKSDFLCIGCPGWFRKEFLPEDRRTIGWTMIETYKLQSKLVDILNNVDVVWNPTVVDYERMKRSGVKVNMEIVHLGYDDNEYNLEVKPVDIVQLRDRYVYGVLGSWNDRKGVKEIIQAFCRAFSKNDKVTLFMICKYGTRPYDGSFGRSKEDIDKWNIKWEFKKYLEEINLNIENAPHIVLLDTPIHEEIMPNVMKNVDCLVGFSRGESTWLPGLQAMAMGIPIIQLKSECSGFMEYLHDVGFLCNESKLIDADNSMYEGTSELYEGCELAIGNVDELTDKFKFLYNYRDSVKKDKRVLNGIKKSKDWTWNKTINKINELLLN